MTEFIQLVDGPIINVIAHTFIDPANLHGWAEAHGMLPVIENDGTPLGVLFEDLNGDASASLDALPEFGGRFCYRSWGKGRERSEYVRNILSEAHGSVLHHSTISFAISGVSRSLSLELLRHHAGADPSQESQRYVDAKDVRFVVPPLFLTLRGQAPGLMDDFERECHSALDAYASAQRRLDRVLDTVASGDVKLGTMRKKRILEAARAHLPNCAETRLLWTMNLRAARHVCALRGGEAADLEIRRLACGFTHLLKTYAPLTFQDFEIYRADDGFDAVRCQFQKV